MNTETKLKSRRPGLAAMVLGSLLTGVALTNWADAGPGRPEPALQAPRPELELGRSNLHDYDPPEPGSYTLPVIKRAADGQVLDAEGQLRSLRTVLDGRITILSFVYLRCGSPKACPYATGVLREIHEVTCQDAALAGRLQLITLSFDPEHDTPGRMADYGNVFRSRGGCDWHFLTTRGPKDLKPLLQAYDQTVDRKPNMDDPLGPYYHPVRVYLIDASGRIRNIYSFGMLDPRILVTDVRTLAQERIITTAK